jgi:hypothetical protein
MSTATTTRRRRLATQGLLLCVAPIAPALLACLEPSAASLAAADPATTPDAGPAVTHDAGTAREVDAGPPSVAFQVSLPGVVQPLEAELREGRVVTVKSYPREARLAARYGTLPADWAGAFSSGFCDDVRAKAQLARKGGLGGRYYRTFVRGLTDAPVQLTLTTVAGTAFEQALLAAAVAAGAAPTDVALENPFLLTGIGLEVRLAPAAMTNLLGDSETLAQSLRQQLMGQLALSAASGVLGAGITAKDLLCDLAQGNAQIVARVEGVVGDQPAQSVTTSVGLQPLGAQP